MGEKRTVKKGKHMGNNGLVHLHFFGMFCAFYSQAKSKKHAESKKHIFFPFCFLLFVFPFFSQFVSLLFCLCFFWILLIYFLVFHFFIYGIFFSVFSSLLILKISNGLVNISVVIFQTPFLQVLWCSMFIWGSVNGLSRVNPLIIGFMNSYYISGMNHQVSKQVISIELPDWTAYYFTYAVHWHHWRIERFDPQEQHGI